MRTLLEWVLTLFLPAQGKHRAAPTQPARHVTRPLPVLRSVRTPVDVINADGLPLVRPYLVHFGRQEERQRQRERRRALVLATMGQDYIAGVSA